MQKQLLSAALPPLPCSGSGYPRPYGPNRRRSWSNSGKTTRVGVYGTINKECTSGPLPIIRVTEPPQHGRLVVIRAKVRISGGGGCPVTELPGLIARYQSRPDFSGADKFTIVIKRPDVEAISTQTIILNVTPANQPTNVIQPPASQMPNNNPPAAPNVPNDNTDEGTESSGRPNDVDVDAPEEIPH